MIGLGRSTLKEAEHVWLNGTDNVIRQMLEGVISIHAAFNKVRLSSDLRQKGSSALNRSIGVEEISESQARELVRLEEPTQVKVLQKVVNEKLTNKETKTLVKKIIDNPLNIEKIIKASMEEFTELPEELSSVNHTLIQLHEDICPQCGLPFVINWAFQRINFKEEE
jgi:hypothetical protein